MGNGEREIIANSKTILIAFPRFANSDRWFHLPHSTFHKKIQFTNLKLKTMKKDTWKFIIQMIVAILTAIATTLGVASCIY
jgi:hypothetical protein